MGFSLKDRIDLERIPRWLKIVAAIYLTYLALVLLVATPLLNFLAPKIYREQTGRELQLDKVAWLNPFTLELHARAAHSANADGSRFWAFDTLKANVSIASLWRGHLVLDALELRGLYLQIDQTAPGRFNFSDILAYRAKHFPAAAPAATAETERASAIVDIDRCVFTAKHLGYRAPYAGEPFAATLSNIRLTLTDFSTSTPQNTKTTTAADAHQAAVALPALRADSIALSLQTATVDFLRAQQPFSTALHDVTMNSPALSTRSTSAQDYALTLHDASNGSAQLRGTVTFATRSAAGKLQLHAINLVPAWQYLANKLAFTTQRALLDGTLNYGLNWGEPLSYRVTDSRLALRDVQLQARDDADTGVAFAALHVDGIAVDSTQPQVHISQVTLDKPVLRGWNRDTRVSLVDMFAMPPSDAPSPPPPSPWQVLIDTVDIAAAGVHWRASQLGDHRFAAAPLTLHATNLHWPEPTPLHFNAATAISRDAEQGAAADGSAATLSVDGTLVPSEISGTIDAAIADLPLTWSNPLVEQQLRATIASGALSANVSLKLDKAQPQLVQSDGSVDHFELRAQADKRKLATWKRLHWRQLALELPRQRLNIGRIDLTQPWVQFRINHDGTTNVQQLLIKPHAEKQALTPSPSPEGRGAQKTTAWRFRLAKIHVDNGAIDFHDASLTSAYRTNLSKLSGDIDGLNSTSKKPAKVGLHGTVDGYAPVALTGTVNPFAARPELNIALDMTNLDLATLTPYSGTYAGYQIDSGQLSVQLAYTLEDGRIKGTNHIVVDKMQLGKQVSGPKVMDLPLRFAIYLLTDANGVLDLGVDVTGDVDDPDFSLGSIIWKAFRNLIVKAVSSPFRALAHLVGAGDSDLSRVEFAAGSAHIDDAQTAKMKKLVSALQEKSKLRLNISGHVSPNRDIEALRDEELSRTLIERSGITATDIHEQSKNWQRAVEKLFEKRFPAEDPEHWQVMQMNDAMRDNEILDPSALQQLATQRALAVKQMLVTDMGLAADRAFVKPVDLGTDKKPGMQVTMQVE